MNDVKPLDYQISRASFWSVIILILSGVLSLFFPLDAPAGPFADRVIWFSSNLNMFILGWIVQMIAMLSLTVIFAGTAWQVARTHPLRAVVAGTVLLISLVAFIIPKFIAISNSRNKT